MTELRLPRALVAFAIGAALAAAGVVLQGITRNALAAPELLGVAAGTNAAAVIVIVAAPLPRSSTQEPHRATRITVSASARRPSTAGRRCAHVLAMPPGPGWTAARSVWLDLVGAAASPAGVPALIHFAGRAA